mmetsp:Transcript_65759/g.140684  ORF Transcript_65759/g.140684 Transcript_65759/m.140684 type:complete len:1127 (+) Transcript_65759:110-3490(+)
MAFNPPARVSAGGDAAAFLETIRQTLSSDNALRPAAEKRYEEAKKQNPVATVAGLFQVVLELQVEQPVREQGAVLLRQCLSKVKDEGSLWLGLGEAAQLDVRGKLLQILEAEPVSQVRRKVADCIQSLGNQLIEIASDQRPRNVDVWPELMPMLMRCICDNSKDSGVRADCLWVVKELACTVWQILVASGEQSVQVLRACLLDSSDAIRSEAAAMLCSLVDNIEAREDRKPFAPLIPEMAGVLAQLANADDSKALNVVLQSLQTTTETADFFKNHVASHIMPVMTGIAKSHKDTASRKYAFEVIITFMESKPKMMLKVSNYVESALEVCLHFMMELDNDVDAWAAEDEDEGEDEEEQFTFGKEAIDRICRCANKVEAFPQVLEVLKPAIAKLFASGDWKQVVAGICTFSQIAEYVDDEATVVQMVQVVKVQLAAAHSRVRHQAWTAITQFAVDHGDVITTDAWAAQLLPEFMKGLEDSCDRVSLRCMEAFQHYGESIEREDLEPFVQPFMEKLGARLQGSQLFKKKAITFIAVIAGQVDDAFAPYYPALMPLLKQVIQDTLHKVEERTLLGKCFECISLLAKAVGKDGFRADAEVIMKAMIEATQTPNMPSSDPVKEYMMAASERICSTMKEDFLPFLPHILPGVLEKLTLAPREFDQEKHEGLDENSEVNLTLTQENGKMKILIMYSSEIQDLKGALEAIHTFVDELGKAYVPFVAQTATALLPVFEFSMAEEIRDLAFETWGLLCGCARDGGQVQVVSDLVMEFLKRILPKLETTEIDLEALKTRADGVTTCLKRAGPGILSADQVNHLCKVSMTLLAESLKRREEGAQDNIKRVAAVGGDEDGDLDLDGEENEDEEGLRVGLNEIVGAIMQHHPDLFVAAANGFPTYAEMSTRLLQTGVNPEDRKLSLFLICDFLEHLGGRVVAQWPQFLPGLLEDILHQSAELRQPACYGASLAAKDPAFAPLATGAASKLAQVVTETRARAKKKSEKIAQACADNALSALGEIVMNHQPSLGAGAEQLWGIWLAGLPCQEDEQEGVRNHKLLLKLIMQERAEVVGAGGCNLQKLFAMLVDLYKTDMVDDETNVGIGQLALKIGEASLEQYAAQYSAKQRKKLQRIVRESQK